MRRTHNLDAKDQEILALLEEDGRRSNSDIARTTGLSPPTVAERIGRLRDTGVIRGFTVRIDEARVGLPVLAIVTFRPRHMTSDDAVKFVAQFPQVRDCYRVTGSALLVMIVRLASNDALKTFLNDLYKNGETETSVILSADVEQRPIFARAN